MGLFDRKRKKPTADLSVTETAISTADMEFAPAILDSKTDLQGYQKLSFSELAASGAAFSMLATPFRTIQQTINIPADGLYRINTMGKVGQLAMKDGESLGAIIHNSRIVGQARWTPVSGLSGTSVGTLPYDPTLLILAVAMHEINQRFDESQKIGLDILDFLEQDKQSELHGNLLYLQDVLAGYKHNCRNEKYKTNQHVRVLAIKQDALQKIDFYRQRIEKSRNQQQGPMHLNRHVDEQRKAIEKEFKNYQLALHIYAFAVFLEVLLLENFDSEYINSMIGDIENREHQYDVLYGTCLRQIKGQAKSSLENRLVGGAGNAIKAIGETVAKIPVISDSQVDESLIAAGAHLMDKQLHNSRNAAAPLDAVQDSAVHPFMENLRRVDQLYNQPSDILFDQDYLYVKVLTA